MQTFAHILVPVDFSETARDALHAAREMIRGTRTRLTLLHVVPDAWRQAWIAEAGVELGALQREWRMDARRRLDAVAAEEGLTDGDATLAIEVGTPHAAIVRYAMDHDVDLIVMGSQGHGVVRRFLLGSVAERVVRTARCPVLTVPHRMLREIERTDIAAAAS